MPNPWYHEMQDLGLNYRKCDMKAALGESQLRSLDQFISRRLQVADFCRGELNSIPGITLPPSDSATIHNSLHLSPPRSKNSIGSG
jgi:dTDP-4-amino-4,6-dideoxygalactose transaminase